MPHDYAELVERLRYNANAGIPDFTNAALLDEAATALARLRAPVTEEEIEAAHRAWRIEYERASASEHDAIRAALAAHRAGRGMA